MKNQRLLLIGLIAALTAIAVVIVLKMLGTSNPTVMAGGVAGGVAGAIGGNLMKNKDK